MDWRKEVGRGLKSALPIVLGYLPLGFVYGVLAPVLLLPEGKFILVGNPYLLAAIPTCLVAIRTRSIAQPLPSCAV
ncbi:MAG: AzlD domain-containing protein [Moorellaceae bacterium]